MLDTFIVKPGNKSIVLIRTDTGRFFEISNRRIKTDGHIDENNGLIPKAVEVSASYVAELYARFHVEPKSNKPKSSLKSNIKSKRKASKFRKLRMKTKVENYLLSLASAKQGLWKEEVAI